VEVPVRYFDSIPSIKFITLHQCRNWHYNGYEIVYQYNPNKPQDGIAAKAGKTKTYQVDDYIIEGAQKREDQISRIGLESR
jgi:hypothetical protein